MVNIILLVMFDYNEKRGRSGAKNKFKDLIAWENRKAIIWLVNKNLVNDNLYNDFFMSLIRLLN